ncbi:hypothetical protein ABRQ22_06730 [Cellulosimicrobium sp. ES-005]|uniref:HNH endonuclease n=1 Tax=Cellulosimicrobium sp. ES-005 TaxID=3163031 RepID=A0AAU8G6N1_9MICO
MAGRSWSGRTVTTARAYWRGRLLAAGALPCWRCGRALTVRSRWTVGHLVSRHAGGSVTDPANQWVECALCNFRAGGRDGAAITNARRKPTTKPRTAAPVRGTEKDRGIRGW